jgi:PEP-CTERM motif
MRFYADVVPEPATWILAAIGLIYLAAHIKTRRLEDSTAVH